MNLYDALKRAADESGTPLTGIGPALGKAANHVHGAINRGSDPSCQNAAEMLEVCGWRLAAMPAESVPEDALIITPKTKAQRKR